MVRRKSSDVWRRTIYTRRFRIGFVVLLLAPIIAFASINVDVATITEEYEHEWPEGYGKVILLPMPLDTKENVLQARFSGQENIIIEITVEDQDYVEIYSFEVQHGDDIEVEIPDNSRYITIPASTEYEGSKLNLNHTMAYNYQPYAILSIPALFLTLIAIVLIYSSHAATLYTLEDEKLSDETQIDNQEKNYKPPTIFDDIDKEDMKDESKK